MNRNAMAVAGLALGLAAAPVAAQQAKGSSTKEGQFYGGAQLAISDVDGYDNGLALVVSAGMNLNPERRGGFGIEGELTTTLSKPEVKVSNASAELSYFTIAGYGVYAVPVDQNFGVRGRLGLLYENLNSDTLGPISGKDGDDFSGSFGIGATYRFTHNLNGIAEYTYIEKDINHLSAGIQLRF